MAYRILMSSTQANYNYIMTIRAFVFCTSSDQIQNLDKYN